MRYILVETLLIAMQLHSGNRICIGFSCVILEIILILNITVYHDIQLKLFFLIFNWLVSKIESPVLICIDFTARADVGAHNWYENYHMIIFIGLCSIKVVYAYRASIHDLDHRNLFRILSSLCRSRGCHLIVSEIPKNIRPELFTCCNVILLDKLWKHICRD